MSGRLTTLHVSDVIAWRWDSGVYASVTLVSRTTDADDEDLWNVMYCNAEGKVQELKYRGKTMLSWVNEPDATCHVTYVHLQRPDTPENAATYVEGNHTKEPY